MNDFFKAVEWLDLERKVPDKLKTLCRLCYNYTKKREYVVSILPFISGNEVAMVQEYVISILEEYIKIIREKIIEKDKLALVVNDLKTINSSFFGTADKDDKERRPKGLDDRFNNYVKNQNPEVSVPLFLATFDSFISSRIYNSLMETHKKNSDIFINNFCIDSINKSGIIEVKIAEKPSEDSDIPGLELVKEKKGK